MKKNFQIALAVMLLIVGCSKDESISDASENNQLKRGSTVNAGVSSISFVGNSVNGEERFELTNLMDQGNIPSKGKIILKNGVCSGSISGYGKINPLLSSYNFESCEQIDNTGAYNWRSSTGQINRSCSHNYLMSGTATIKITTSNYFVITITEALLIPFTYEPLFFGPDQLETFYGALFGCQLNGYGSAKVTYAVGKCSTLLGRTVEVGLGRGNTINRETGEMNFGFRIK